MYHPINCPTETPCRMPINYVPKNNCGPSGPPPRPHPPVMPPQSSCVEMVEVKEIKPYMDSSTGAANPNFQPFTSFSIVRKECCPLTIRTDAGTIILPEYVDCYSSCDFGCDLTFIEISGACTDDVTIVVNGKHEEVKMIPANCCNNLSSGDCNQNSNPNCNCV